MNRLSRLGLEEDVFPGVLEELAGAALLELHGVKELLGYDSDHVVDIIENVDGLCAVEVSENNGLLGRDERRYLEPELVGELDVAIVSERFDNDRLSVSNSVGEQAVSVG